MHRLFRLALFLSALCLSLPLWAQSRIDCSALHSGILKTTVHYCVYLPPSYDDGAAKTPAQTYPILYFLHGLGDNERALSNSGGWTMIDDLRRQHKIGEFIIAVPEAGQTFYVNTSDGKVRYSDFFLQEFLPYIEKNFRVAKGTSSRGITGISMGGFGALRFAFAYPQMFGSVSAQSAALMTQSPEEIDAAAHSGAPIGKLLGPIYGNPVNVQHWKDNTPAVLAHRNAAALKKLPIYFNCGQSDDYGFEKGAEELHARLKKDGVPHQYHLYPGDHSLTYFLSHFPEVMEFHSRAFGLK